MNEVIYAVILWFTTQGNVTGVIEEVYGGDVACQNVMVLAAAKSEETGKTIVAKCTNDVLEIGRLISEFDLEYSDGQTAD